MSAVPEGDPLTDVTLVERSPGPAERELLAALSGDDPAARARAALQLGVARLRDDPAEGRRLLEVASGGPDSIAAGALIALARDIADRGDDSSALERLHRAQELAWRGGDALALLAVSEAYVSLDQESRAIAVLEGVVNRRSADTPNAGMHDRKALAAASLQVGRLLWTTNRARALSALRRSVHFADGDSSLVAALELAQGYRQRMREAAARDDCRGLAEVRAAQVEELLRLAATSPNPDVACGARLVLGEVLTENGQHDAARDEWAAVADDPFAGPAGEQAWLMLAGSHQHTAATTAVGPAAETPDRPADGRHRPASTSPTRAAARVDRVLRKVRGLDAPRRLLLVGAGSGARYLLPELRRDTGRFFIEGFVDDREDAAYAGETILGPVSRLGEIARRLRPDGIILTAATAPGRLRMSVLEAAWAIDVPVQQLPPMFEIRRDRPLLPQLRAIRVEETYGERPWLVDRTVHGMLRGQVVLITGAGGVLGAELARQVARAQPRALVLVDRAEAPLERIHEELADERGFAYGYPVIADCASRAEMDVVFAQHAPKIVLHCAALNHANTGVLSVSHPARANLVGPVVVTEAARRAGARLLVCLSTDHSAVPRTEHDAARALAEQAVLRLSSPDMTTAVLRIGSVWCAPGGVLDQFERQLDTGGPLKVKHPDAARRFVHAWEVGQALLRLLHVTQSGQLYALQSGEDVRIEELALRMIAMRRLRYEDDISMAVGGDARAAETTRLYGPLEQPVPTPELSDIVEVQQDDGLLERLDHALREIDGPLRAMAERRDEPGDAASIRAVLYALLDTTTTWAPQDSAGTR